MRVKEGWRRWLGLNWDRYGVAQERHKLGEVVLYALLRGGGKTEDNNGVGWYQYLTSESTVVLCDVWGG